MDVDRRLLVEHLQRLEQQAATVESLIDWDDTDLVQQIADGWAPSSKRTQRVWLDWLKDCGDRWR